MDPGQPRKILFLAANPWDSARLALDEEVRLVEDKLRNAEHRDALVLKPRFAVRLDDVLQALNEDRPCVVHFAGHGDQDAIWLQGGSTKPERVNTRTLVHLFRALHDDIRVVVLNACYSRDQAEAITGVIDCAIGMPSTILNGPASEFAAAFYRALGFGRSVRNAFDQALVLLLHHGVDDGDLPELLTRRGVDPDEVFAVDPDARPR